MMKVVISAVALLVGSVALRAQTIQILRLEPTVLFSNHAPLQQVAWLSVENSSKEPLKCEIALKIDGVDANPPQFCVLPQGPSQQNVLIPDIAKPAALEVRIMVDGEVLASYSVVWRPQRKWKVFVVKSDHEDIGYENFIYVKQKEIADYIDLGRRQSGNPEEPPGSSVRAPEGYHFYMETLLFPRYYVEERSEVALRELLEDAVKPGIMGLGGAPAGLHTHWMDYEELARMTYPGRREYKDRFGLDLDTFVTADNPTLSWSACEVLADSGFRYAIRFGQPFRTGGNNDYATTKLPAVFWWQAPDGKGRVLFSWRSHYGVIFWFGPTNGGYGAAAGDLTDLAAVSVNRELNAVQTEEKLGPYPYDAVLIPSYMDHEVPSWNNREFVKWQETYRYPEIRIANPRDFMVYMEKNYGDKLPILSGDLNNFTADFATIDPEGQGWKRRAARLLPLAEGLAAVAGAFDPGLLPQAQKVRETYVSLMDFDEHCWPTNPLPQEFQQFNVQWGKHLDGKRALVEAQRLADCAMKALLRWVPTRDERLLAVFNPLAHARTDLVIGNDEIGPLVDMATGKPVPTQSLGNGKTAFVASEVPAFGYKTYRFADKADPPLVPTTPEALESTIANEYYVLKFDSASGAIVSIYDRQLKRELVDPTARYKFNQLVWVRKNDKESIDGANYVPAEGARLTVRRGPVFVEMVARLTDAAMGGAVITQTVRLYTGLKRFDIVDNLRHVGILNTPYAFRYRENIYYAFPIKVERFVPRVEYAGGVVRPFDDQLRWGSHDFLEANRWVDVSNPDFGVTMAPWNEGIMNFGEIRYNHFSIDYRPISSHLYSYAWSNRMQGLLNFGADDWNATLGYSFTSHPGDWNSGAAVQLGWSVASPMEVLVLPAGQKGPLPAAEAGFLNLDVPNVQLVVLKESEQPGRGWIVRLVETDGKAADVTVDLGRFHFDGATMCDLVENDQESLPVRNGKVRVSIGPYAFATLRVFAKEPAPVAVASVRAEPLSDESVKVSWTAVAAAAAYNVFRSSDPREPATAYSLVGRTIGLEFVDHGLNLDTNYRYYVAAITANSTQGATSSHADARTLSKNTSPPSSVPELGIIRLPDSQLIVCWHKCPEPDVARYLVFRAETPRLDPRGETQIASVSPSGYNLERFTDTGLAPGKTYYYRVLAEDWAGNRQTISPLASATTSKK